MTEIETLVCKVGNHEWTRERRRGKKPTICPDHQVEKQSLDSEERQRRMQEGRERAQRERNRELIQAIKESSANQGINCFCDIPLEATWDDLRSLGGGCKDPAYCCTVLDRVRRELDKNRPDTQPTFEDMYVPRLL